MSWKKNSQGKYEWVNESAIAQGLFNLYGSVDNYLEEKGVNRWGRNVAGYLRPIVPHWLSGKLSPRAEGFWATLGAPGTLDPRTSNPSYSRLSPEARTQYDQGANIGNMAFNSVLPALGSVGMAYGARATGAGLPINRPTEQEGRTLSQDVKNVRQQRYLNPPSTDQLARDQAYMDNQVPRMQHNRPLPELGYRAWRNIPSGLRGVMKRYDDMQPYEGNYYTEGEWLESLNNFQRPPVRVRPLP